MGPAWPVAESDCGPSLRDECDAGELAILIIALLSPQVVGVIVFLSVYRTAGPDACDGDDR